MLGPDLHFTLSPAPCTQRSRHNPTAVDIREFDSLILVVGPNGLSAQQKDEWNTANQLSAQDGKFVVLPVAAGSALPPKGINLGTREWFELPVVTDRKAVRALIQILKSCKL